MRYAFRTLLKNPILTIVALLSLGIGIGANTAIFTLMDRLILRSLPVRDPDRLVMFYSPGRTNGFIQTTYGNPVSFSWPKYRMLRDRSGDIFEGLLARYPFEVSIAAKGQTDRSRGEMVSGNYFDVLGVRPALGRLLADDDARTRGGNPVAVLSYGYWMRRFGGNPAVLNQSILVNGEALTIIGVTQAGFQSVGSGEAPTVFVPITMLGRMNAGFDEFENPHGYWLNIFGRVRPGVSREKAEASVGVLWHSILADDIQTLPSNVPAVRQQYLNKKLQLRPGGGGISSIRSDFTQPLYLLMGMVGLVLLIACANVANLLLARAAARSKELAIRISLGASRARLVGHVLAESALLTLGGGFVGLLIAAWSTTLILRLVPQGIPVAGMDADPDPRVLGFTLAVSILTGLLFGSVPALRATRMDVGPAMKEQTATPSTGGHARFRKALVVAQIALSTLLLAGAGLFAHSLYNLKGLNPGFRTDHLMTFRIDPQLSGYTPERSLRLFEQVRQNLAATPGISAVSMAKEPLLTGSSNINSYRVEGYQPPDGKNVGINVNRVGPDFFSVMGIPLLAGREIRESDNAAAPPVVIINETAAKKYFEGRNPIGLHLFRGTQKVVQFEIGGVVKDAKYDDLREEPRPFAYFPAEQDTAAGPMSFYVRSSMTADALAGPIRQVLRSLDPDLPVSGLLGMEDQILESVFLDRLVAALACAFAALATLLAAIGLYGVIAWAVTQRRREIGIRMAMGATAGDVMRMVLREVVWLGGMGMMVAVPLWAISARVLKAQLFGVTSYDPLTLLVALATLAAVAASAGFVPAFRAARIDPNRAIRYE